ncbi:hypothetical protein [Streptomyces sp. ISL-11]|uniref:hypothetical protein n=1 Tax=Streptomyces sp. ISL-11 TaxID=2819174 RepID=UPI001BEB5454|nr:hypothetical protein [Streptomyces sp. ISL-11]MBT2384201.1 hypothetical protein [Streptomyces sp. ISL-11]
MSAGPNARTSGTVQTRLPWWALVIPVVAFASLLALLTVPASAEPGSAHGGPGAVSRVVEFVQTALARQAP